MAKARAIVAQERTLASKSRVSLRPSRRLLVAAGFFCLVLLVMPLFLRPSAVKAPVSQESSVVALWASAIDSRASSSGTTAKEVVLSSNLSSLVELYAKASGKRPDLASLTGSESSLKIDSVFGESKIDLLITRFADGRMNFSFRPGSTFCLNPATSLDSLSTTSPKPCR